MNPLRCSQTISRLLRETLPAANHSRDRFSRLVAVLSNEENLPVAEAERSHNDIAKLLRRALRVKLAAASDSGDPPWSDAIDFYPSSFVYMVRGIYYEAPYSIDEAGVVTIGEPTEVIPIVTYQAVKAPEPAPVATEEQTTQEGVELLGDCLPLGGSIALIEGELREASADIRIATPGWGSTGYYSAEVLKRDGPKVFPAGTKMYWNHPTESEAAERPEGDLDKLAGITTAPARWLDQGPEGAGLYTKARLREKYSADIAELKGDIGVSLRAVGRCGIGKAEGREGTIIEQLTSGKSIDFVTQAGRGGKVLELFESAGKRQPATTAADGRKKGASDMAMTEEEVRQLQEAVTLGRTAQATSERLSNELLLLKAEKFIAGVCESVSLPLAVKKRVVATMSHNPIVKDGAIDEAAFTEAIKAKINEELSYLREAGVSGVTGFGATSATKEEPVSLEEAEKQLNAALGELVQ